MSCVVVQLRRIYPSFAEDEIIFIIFLHIKRYSYTQKVYFFPTWLKIT